MKTINKNKSRARLYNLINGTEEFIGAAGRLAVGSILFTDIPLAGETVTIGGYVFEAQAAASEAAGTSAGTVADPHLFQSITNLATAGASLAAQILAETTTTGAWGYLYPDDSVGCDFTTATLTLTFWPGTGGNAVTLAGSGDITTLVQPVTASLGRAAKVVTGNYKYSQIDTTGSTQNKEYYVIDDGQSVGDTVLVVIKSAGGSDTPALVGRLSDAGTAEVEALFTTGEVGMSVEFRWDGAVWELLREGQGTAIAFTPSA